MPSSKTPGSIVEGSNGDAVDPPVAQAQQQAAAVELAAHVRALAHVDQASGAISHLLTTQSQRRGRIDPSPAGRQVEERLLEVELVLVDRVRRAFAAVLEGAVELAEHTDVRSEMEVAEQHVALQEDAVIVLRIVAPDRVVRVLVALAHLAAERQVGVAALVERDVFERVERIGAQRRVAQDGPVLLVPQALIFGTLGRLCRRRPVGREEQDRRVGDERTPCPQGHRTLRCGSSAAIRCVTVGLAPGWKR